MFAIRTQLFHWSELVDNNDTDMKDNKIQQQIFNATTEKKINNHNVNSLIIMDD